jgi:hypothetical protein
MLNDDSEQLFVDLRELPFVPKAEIIHMEKSKIRLGGVYQFLQ